jgi:hypothetical protein
MMKVEFEIQNKVSAKRSLFCVAILVAVIAGASTVHYLNPDFYQSKSAEIAAATAPKLQSPDLTPRITPPQSPAAVAAQPNQDPVTPLVKFKKPIHIGLLPAGADELDCLNAEDDSPKSVAQMVAGAKPYSLLPETGSAPIALSPEAKNESKPKTELKKMASSASSIKVRSAEKFSVIGATEKSVTVNTDGVIRTIFMNEALPNGAIFKGYDGQQIKTNLGVYLIN